MQQGLPQGSVLAPLLFLFYINNLADLLPEDIVNSMFADDVALLGTDRSPELAQAKVQAAIDICGEVESGVEDYSNIARCFQALVTRF